MPGVRICQFELAEPGGEKLLSLPIRGGPFQFETFFCLGGRLAAERADAPPCLIEERGVLLLSDVSGLRSFRISGNLSGILVAVDARAARPCLSALCAAMGLELDTGVVKRKMAEQRGCGALSDRSWSQALFASLESLAPEARGQYCVLKAVELLYLLGTQDPALEPEGERLSGDGMARSIRAVGAYMQEHLGEKLTIPVLSRQCSLSPTALKTGFRRVYGVPVHRWLMEQRMKRSCALLRSTGLTVQQVAQAVGYDGQSQFSAVFRQYYGVTPGQYKKMSKTDGACPIP